VIGITPSLLSPRDYEQAVVEAGGLPLLLPLTCADAAETARALLAGVQGLILSGGGDIDPAHYGQQSQFPLRKVQPERDCLELALAREALHRRLPTLGICRGFQVLVVAAGGTLLQHIAGHESSDPSFPASHRVRLDPDSRLARIFGATELQVNTSHHQAAERIGDLRPVAWSDDGLVEAVEQAGSDFVIGVQWHPEQMLPDSPEQLRLLAGLVAAAQSVPRANENPHLRI
jgi:putative glutamine amidotransferase